jgi:hypothetical protein
VRLGRNELEQGRVCVPGLLAEFELLRDRMCCTLNYICNFLGMRDVD